MFKASIISIVLLPLTVTCALAQANTMTSGRPSAALNPEQCEAIWNNAVPSGDLSQPPRHSSSTSRRLITMAAGTSRRLNFWTPAPRVL
jgi:hypothetical protein